MRVPELSVGTSLHNFTVVSRNPLPEYRGEGIYLRHRTGCTVYHLANDDIDNLFSFAFRTLPENNRGTAHIIEHSVLSGSKQFPLKDPFIALTKGSVNTFLNAMTYPDKTVYPASSTVSKDYFNLMRVYGDAVFFPLLKREIFHQEGRRYELGPDGKLDIVGVVYNEMVGNYSDVDSIVGEWSYRSLFTDSPYRFDSGGDPEAIPELTYEEFLEFHRRLYHPANCRIFLYGNIPTEPQLAFLEENFLAQFEPGEAPPVAEMQRRWESPKLLEVPAPLGEGEDPAGKTSITINWLTGSALEPKEMLTMEVLSEILLGNSGAPIQKAIVESGLGEDLSPQSGLETDIPQLAFTIGIRGTDPEKKEAFEELVVGELYKLAEQGIPEAVIEGALKRVEFRNREIQGSVPFGLRLMGKALRGWLHDADPETTLLFTKWMEEVKREAAEGGYFEGFIRSELLENPHRSTVIVRPDPIYSLERQRTARERLDAYLASLGEEERSTIVNESAALKKFQDSPDDPAAIASIPSLKLEDIPREVEKIETGERRHEGVTIYTNELFTNGIVYIDLAFDLLSVPEEQLVLLPLFSKAACGLGFPGVPYDEVARQLALKTGGVYSFLDSSGIPSGDGGIGAYLFFRLKVLREDLEEGLALFERIMRESDFDDTRRLHDLLFEMRNDFKSSVLPRGNAYAALRAASRLSQALAREELWGGTRQLLYLDGLARREHAEQELTAGFNALREQAIVRRGLSVSVAAESGALEDVVAAVKGLVDRTPAGVAAAGSAPEVVLPSEVETRYIESFAIPSEVGYAATVLPASRVGEPSHANEVLLAHMLRGEFLWEQIRMRGGAYGAGATANGTEGLFSFSSYRDPRATDTLEVFRSALEFAARNPMDGGALEKTAIGAIGRDLRPMSPGEKNLVGLRRKLYDISDEMRQAKRDALFAARPEGIAAAAERLLEAYDGRSSALLAGTKALEEARSTRTDITEPVRLPL